jgi:hypothetical protein
MPIAERGYGSAVDPANHPTPGNAGRASTRLALVSSCPALFSLQVAASQTQHRPHGFSGHYSKPAG